MKKFLLEVYTDEIPATQLNGLTLQFKNLARNKLSEYKLNFGEVNAYSTPRRLVLFIDGVEEKEADSIIEIKGPPYKIAFDESGNKTEIYQKFLESNDLSQGEVFEKEIKGNKYLFGKKHIEGKLARDILQEISLYAIKNLTFSRGMRWNASNVAFIRPIRSILALYGEEVIGFEYANVESSNRSFGFFFDSPNEFIAKTPEEYFKRLRELYVVLDFEERKKNVLTNINTLAYEVKGRPDYTNEFLEEVINLTEFPTPFLCELHMENLAVPDCIIESVVKDHLKSFPVLSIDKSHLLPYFIGVRNGTSDFIENVKQGYERVARARLYDGAFFFEEDRKVKLEDRVNALKDVIFIRDLGTLFDKTERLVKISTYLGTLLNLSVEEKAQFSKAAYLSKADVVTQVVKEFPELQGKMGEIYAKLDGADERVAKAIYEQYLPRFLEDELPKTRLGKYLSIIDKLDTLVLGILSNIEFSSSKDPFGLRKDALGIVQVAMTLSENTFPFTKLIDFITDLGVVKKDKEEAKKEVVALLKDRANSFIKSSGITYDKVNAVTNLPIDDLPTYMERAKILEKHANDEKFKDIVIAHKRIHNILEKSGEEGAEINKDFFFDAAEIELFESAKETEHLTTELLKQRDYEAIIQLLYLFVPTVNKFFDNVLVMDNNENIRKNRLALLNFVKATFEKFADFSEVVVEG